VGHGNISAKTWEKRGRLIGLSSLFHDIELPEIPLWSNSFLEQQSGRQDAVRTLYCVCGCSRRHLVALSRIKVILCGVIFPTFDQSRGLPRPAEAAMVTGADSRHASS
jgi:hypothetical protein